jgi:DNA-binding NtrC family response regulator
MCERLAALVSSKTITAQDILDQLHDQYIDPSQSNLVMAENTKQSLGEQERLFFEEALQRSCWNKSKTAAMLGISRVTLWRKLKELGIE